MNTRITFATKGPAVLVSMAFVVGILVWWTANASWRAVPLSERIKDADLVVRGELYDVKPKYYSITWRPGNESEQTDIFDIGKISKERILKGERGDKGGVGFAFPHADQPNHPFRHMHTSFTEGPRGIWILHRGTGGFYYVRRPDNFLEDKVLATFQIAEKAVGRHVSTGLATTVMEAMIWQTLVMVPWVLILIVALMRYRHDHHWTNALQALGPGIFLLSVCLTPVLPSLAVISATGMVPTMALSTFCVGYLVAARRETAEVRANEEVEPAHAVDC